MQKTLLIGTCALAVLNVASAEQAIENFENGNAAQWTWVGDAPNAVVKTTGGNPDGWFDSGSSYTSNQPGVGSIPPAGSALQTALASGSLRSVSFDFQRLDQGSCSPQSNDAGNFALTLTDFHTAGGFIDAVYVGDESPGDISAWQSHSFPIDSQAATVPDGWMLEGAPDDYTWSDLMHNIDLIKISAADPGLLSHVLCYRFGIDNIVVSYGEKIFADDFETKIQ
jgi:hypothetical protein